MLRASSMGAQIQQIGDVFMTRAEGLVRDAQNRPALRNVVPQLQQLRDALFTEVESTRGQQVYNTEESLANAVIALSRMRDIFSQMDALTPGIRVPL